MGGLEILLEKSAVGGEGDVVGVEPVVDSEGRFEPGAILHLHVLGEEGEDLLARVRDGVLGDGGGEVVDEEVRAAGEELRGVLEEGEGGLLGDVACGEGAGGDAAVRGLRIQHRLRLAVLGGDLVHKLAVEEGVFIVRFLEDHGEGEDGLAGEGEKMVEEVSADQEEIGQGNRDGVVK